MEKTFRIRPYRKQELACAYFPYTSNPKSAVANLRNLINRNPKLRAALDAAGYRSTDKVFTPRQVRVIVEFAGEPYS